jgi:hypothetical protein
MLPLEFCSMTKELLQASRFHYNLNKPSGSALLQCFWTMIFITRLIITSISSSSIPITYCLLNKGWTYDLVPYHTHKCSLLYDFSYLINLCLVFSVYVFDTFMSVAWTTANNLVRASWTVPAPASPPPRVRHFRPTSTIMVVPLFPYLPRAPDRCWPSRVWLPPASLRYFSVSSQVYVCVMCYVLCAWLHVCVCWWLKGSIWGFYCCHSWLDCCLICVLLLYLLNLCVLVLDLLIASVDGLL